MRFSTIALLAVTAIVFSANAVKAEEPEHINNAPETTTVPLPDVLYAVADGEKSSFAQIENAVIHVDGNNRLVGLSN